MKTRTLHVTKLLMGVCLMTISLRTFADSAGTKIADCNVVATSDSPAESLTVFFKGGDRNSADQYSVHFVLGANSKDAPVQALQWADNGATLGIQFANFLIASIHNGQSSNSTLGVMLGGAPSNMTCNAKF